jgi:hypothetical protein
METTRPQAKKTGYSQAIIGDVSGLCHRTYFDAAVFFLVHYNLLLIEGTVV